MNFLLLPSLKHGKTETAKVLYDLPLHAAVHYCGVLRVGGRVSISVHDTLQFCIKVDLTHGLHNIIVDLCSSFFDCQNVVGCVYLPPGTMLEVIIRSLNFRFEKY